MNNPQWLGYFDRLAGISAEAVPRNDGDYIGEDGLLYCGKCHTKKQTRITFTFGKEQVTKTPPRLCDCARKAAEDELQQRQAQKRVDAVARLREASLMDSRFKGSTFLDFHVNQHNAKAHKIAKRYAERFEQMMESNQGLLFYGAPGTGKTFAAACIANQLLENQIPVVMTSFVKLMDMDNHDDESIIRRLNLADLLIIDDLGAERGTDYALEKVYNFVDSRYRAKKPMLLTTNLTLDQIKSTTDMRYQRIYDRILQCCYPVEFTGPSWRRREAAARFDAMKALLED